MLRDFVYAANKNNSSMWDMVRDITEPKICEPEITIDVMADEFEERLTMPATMPTEFYIEALERAMLEAEAIPLETEDTTPPRFFSRPWTEEDIQRV